MSPDPLVRNATLTLSIRPMAMSPDPDVLAANAGPVPRSAVMLPAPLPWTPNSAGMVMTIRTGSPFRTPQLLLDL